jgi:hypothetical protein
MKLMLLFYDAFVRDRGSTCRATNHLRTHTLGDEPKANRQTCSGRVHSTPPELENTLRRLKTSGTMTSAVPADARMPIIRLEWSAIAP